MWIRINKYKNFITLIIKSTLQTKKYRVGFWLLLRFNTDLFLIYFYNVVRFKKIKSSYQKYIKKNLTISYNWFGNSPQIWFYFFKRLKLFGKKIKILEIGSFEGLSLLYYYYIFIQNNISVTAVDMLSKKSLHFRNFRKNTKLLKNFKFYNLKSSEFFKKKIKKKYNLIYIDGSHYYKDVFLDAKNSFKVLEKGGLIIFDDFVQDWTKKNLDNHLEYHNVIGGVLLFLDTIKNYKTLYVGHQVIIQKK
jgi:predicted O-methyltransferase YrrM